MHVPVTPEGPAHMGWLGVVTGISAASTGGVLVYFEKYRQMVGQAYGLVWSLVSMVSWVWIRVRYSFIGANLGYKAAYQLAVPSPKLQSSPDFMTSPFLLNIPYFVFLSWSLLLFFSATFCTRVQQ